MVVCMLLYYIILSLVLYILIFFFPWYLTFYTEGKLKCYLIMFGFVRVPINIYRMFNGFTTRKNKAKKEFNIMEVVENYKKYLSIRPIYQDLFKKSTIKHLYWYSAVPMENPLLGLSLFPIYTTVQQVIISNVYEQFKKVNDVDVDTKFNYLSDEVFIYFDCIIRINLAKIISVSVKYITKIPLLLKRAE